MAKTKGQIVRETAMQWMREGKLSAPPDDPASEDDREFWAEVERRCAEAGVK